MKMNKKIMAMLAVALIASFSPINHVYGLERASATSEKLIGKERYETAIKISEKGWPSGANEAVIVNDMSIVDAISVTPFAYLKNAPILLTQKDSLNAQTKAQLKKLGVKNVYVIGGENALSKNIENELKKENITVDRIQGATRENTAVEIAKRIEKITPVTEVAVVNGYNGLADAVSIASLSSIKNMPIILSNLKDESEIINDYISGKNIRTSYVIGGPTVVSDKMESTLPNATRIAGKTRGETNAKVIENFYTDDELDNLYVSKDGSQNQNQLIDALSVGVLAAKNNSPVVIVSSKLTESQKDVINTKSFNTVTQVGGNGNEASFNEISNIQKETVYDVTSVTQLNEAITKADANDTININMVTRASEDINISTDKKISINLSGNYQGTITVNTPNAKISNKGTIKNIVVTSNNKLTANGVKIINEGQINNLQIKDNAKGTVENKVGSTIVNLQVASNSSKVEINNKGNIDAIKNDSSNTTINNSGTIAGGNGGEELPPTNPPAEEPPIEIPPVVVDKEVEAIINKINSIPENITIANDVMLSEIKAEYDNLSESQKSSVTNASKLNDAMDKLTAIKLEIEQNEIAAKSVIDKINLLPSEITLEDKEEVELVEAEYNKLTQNQKNLVSNKSKLDNARAQLDEKIREEEEKQENMNSANLVIAEIDKLPELDEITVDNKDLIIQVKNSYDQLNEEAKKLIPEDKVIILENAYNKMMELDKIEMDKASAKLVTNNIQKLDRTITRSDEAEINSARMSYNALNSEAKDLVDNVQILVDAEFDLEKSKDKIIAVSRTIAIIDKEVITLDDKDSLIAAKEAYATLTVDEKRYISSLQKSQLIRAELEIERLETIEKHENIKQVINLINALPDAKDVAEEHRVQIETARNKYNLIDDSLKFTIDITKLLDAEAKLK